MHTYRQTGPTEWTVGFERQGVYVRWRPIMVFATEAEAAGYCAYLNGGTAVTAPVRAVKTEPKPEPNH